MKVACTECGKKLMVGDESAGRRVKCPGCKQVFTAAAEDDIAAAVSAKPIAAPRKPAVPAPLAASVQQGSPRAPARKRCPECGAGLLANGRECSECEWTAEQAPAKKKSRRAERAASTEDDEGHCFVDIEDDNVKLNEAVEERLKKLIATEQLNLRINRRDEPPEDLAPNDVVISGAVTRCDYGNQFIRYFLTMISLIGPGSCRLEVEAEVETGDGDRQRIRAHARQGVGFLGGTGAGLMKMNVNMVAVRITNAAVRRITGRWLLNYHAYLCAYWSLGLGIAALIPCAGGFLAPVSMTLGAIALVAISTRQLPRGKVPAVTGILLSMVGFIESVAVLLLSQMRM